MKRLTLLLAVIAVAFAAAACTPRPSPHDPGSQGYPDDPKADQ